LHAFADPHPVTPPFGENGPTTLTRSSRRKRGPLNAYRDLGALPLDSRLRGNERKGLDLSDASAAARTIRPNQASTNKKMDGAVSGPVHVRVFNERVFTVRVVTPP
jgi:hypothetical protein